MVRSLLAFLLLQSSELPETIFTVDLRSPHPKLRRCHKGLAFRLHWSLLHCHFGRGNIPRECEWGSQVGRNAMRLIWTAVAGLGLMGCAQQQTSTKPGATVLSGQAESDYRAINAEVLANCRNPRFAAYYARSPCIAGQATAAQLGDTSTMSPADRPVLLEVRAAADKVGAQLADANRQYLGENGVKFAQYFYSTLRPQQQKITQELYNGAITWGEFNRKRQEISKATLAFERSQ
jgi:hypothetical protein